MRLVLNVASAAAYIISARSVDSRIRLTAPADPFACAQRSSPSDSSTCVASGRNS